MYVRTIAAAIAFGAASFSALTAGYPAVPVAQSNPWPDEKPNYIASCRHALMTAQANQDKASSENAPLVEQFIAHARDSQAKGNTFQCLNEAQQAIEYEK